MATTLDASNLTLNKVKALLKFQEQVNNSFTSLLALEPLTESEQEELEEIRELFDSYYGDGKISEGQIRFLFLAPLLRLAGFYTPRIKILLEEKIAGSAKPNPIKEVAYTFETWGQQIADFCRKVVGKPVFLVGNSIGCIVPIALQQPLEQISVEMVFSSLYFFNPSGAPVPYGGKPADD